MATRATSPNTITTRSRRFAAAALALGAATLSLLLAGCSGDATASTPPPASATAAATVASAGASTATATPDTRPRESRTHDGVADLAGLFDDALVRGDTAALTARLAGPNVFVSQWGGPASPVALDRASRDLTQLLTRVRPSDRDSYGFGAPKVWRMGQDMSRPYVMLTAISLDEATGYRRLAVILQLKYCEADCPGGVASGWTITGIVSNWGGQAFLDGDPKVDATFGTIGARFRRPLELTQDVRDAAAAVAARFGAGTRAIPNCIPTAPCITTADPGVAVDLGIMRLAYNPPEGQGGAAAIFAGRTPAGTWDFWYGTQQGVYRLADLPGDILVCAGGDGLNIREKPDQASKVVGFAKDLTRLRADQFVLTTPGAVGAGGASGSGWYHVTGPTPATTGWVSSQYITDARLKDCTVHDQIEKAG